jgi:hypothetical protein
MCRLSKNLGASTSWSPKGLPRPVWDCFNFTFTFRSSRQTPGYYLRFALFWDITSSSGNPLPTFRDLDFLTFEMGTIRCPETSVKYYHSTLRNIPEERRSHQHGGGSLKSRIITWIYVITLRGISLWLLQLLAFLMFRAIRLLHQLLNFV